MFRNLLAYSTMKKKLVLATVFLLFNFSFGQILDHQNLWYVMNIKGTNVYEEPTFNSKILAVLSVGESILIEKSLGSNEHLTIANGFSLEGNWIKPEKIQGYIFSADLTDKELIVNQDINGQVFINLLGKLINEEEKEEVISTDNGEFVKYSESEYYENGSYTNTTWDGCFYHMTKYHNLSLNEVYYQMVSDHGTMTDENEFMFPIFQERSANTLKFEGYGATEDLKIELLENGIILVSTYDCT